MTDEPAQDQIELLSVDVLRVPHVLELEQNVHW